MKDRALLGEFVRRQRRRGDDLARVHKHALYLQGDMIGRAIGGEPSAFISSWSGLFPDWSSVGRVALGQAEGHAQVRAAVEQAKLTAAPGLAFSIHKSWLVSGRQPNALRGAIRAKPNLHIAKHLHSRVDRVWAGLIGWPDMLHDAIGAEVKRAVYAHARLPFLRRATVHFSSESVYRRMIARIGNGRWPENRAGLFSNRYFVELGRGRGSDLDKITMNRSVEDVEIHMRLGRMHDTTLGGVRLGGSPPSYLIFWTNRIGVDFDFVFDPRRGALRSVD